MSEIARGIVKRKVDLCQSFIHHLGQGLVATDGVVYSAVATVGTTAVEVLNELLDPGVDLSLTELEVSFTQKFTELTDAVGSLVYHWQGRSEWSDPVGTLRTSAWTAISGTYSKGIGSLANSEDTLEGYLDVANLKHAPLRIRLLAEGLVASSMEGKVKNDSYVRLVGIVVPGA